MGSGSNAGGCSPAAILSFTVNLVAANGGTILGGQATGTIENPNPEPTVSISEGVVSAGSAPPYTQFFTISLSAPSNLATTVTYDTGNIGTRAGAILPVPSTTVVLAPGQTEYDVSVVVANNLPLSKSLLQNTGFAVDLTDVTNAILSSGSSPPAMVACTFRILAV